MERIVVVNWAVLCIAIVVFEIVLSIPYHDSHQLSLAKKRDEDNNKQSYLWFGPRLGRKKRNSNHNNVYPNVAREDFAALMDAIQDAPWAVVAVNEGKRHVVNFTPRLGRESGEESNNGFPADQWLQDSEISEELLSQRSPPFAPRLGRHLSPFSPRLGRDNDKIPLSYLTANNNA